jgi:hypothetical protein
MIDLEAERLLTRLTVAEAAGDTDAANAAFRALLAYYGDDANHPGQKPYTGGIFI